MKCQSFEVQLIVAVTFVACNAFVRVWKRSWVPLVLISMAHQPVFVLLPISSKRPSDPGPLPELVVVLFQSGLYQNRTVPLRQLILAIWFVSTSRYLILAVVFVSTSRAYPFQLVTPKTFVKEIGNCPCSPTQVFVLLKR